MYPWLISVIIIVYLYGLIFKKYPWSSKPLALSIIPLIIDSIHVYFYYDKVLMTIMVCHCSVLCSKYS